MFCWKCGKQIPDESLFCTYCGVSVTQKAQPASTGTAAPKTNPSTGTATSAGYTGKPNMPVDIPVQPKAEKPDPKPAAPVNPPPQPKVEKPSGMRPVGPVPEAPVIPQKPVGTFRRYLNMIVLSAGVSLIISSMVVPGVIVTIIGLIMRFGGGPTKAIRNLTNKQTDNGLLISWDEQLDSFAVAVNKAWRFTGSGKSVLIPYEHLSDVMRTGVSRFEVHVARNNGSSTSYYGECTVYPMSKYFQNVKR